MVHLMMNYMKWPRSSLDNTKVICLGLLFFILSGFTGIAGAIEKEPADKLAAAKYSMIGLRLGFWADMAESGNISDTTIDADLPDAGFYTEIFFDYRLARPLFLQRAPALQCSAAWLVHLPVAHPLDLLPRLSPTFHPAQS